MFEYLDLKNRLQKLEFPYFDSFTEWARSNPAMAKDFIGHLDIVLSIMENSEVFEKPKPHPIHSMTFPKIGENHD